MARQTTQLTDKAITTAKAKEKKYKLYDGGGLFLLVMPTGSKLWRLKYRFDAKEKEYAIGIYPTITLKKARDTTLELKRLVADGIDPNEKKKQDKKIDTEDKKLTEFEEKSQLHLVVHEWLALHEKNVNANTAKKTRALLYNKLLPTFATFSPNGYVKTSTPISHIQHPQIVKILKEVAKETEYTAKKLKQFLGRIWLFAATSGYCDSNIIANISDEVLPTPKVKNSPKITDEIILGKLLRDIDTYRGNIIVKASLQFVVYTMLRATNLAELKWEYIDFEDRTITIPRHLMKIKDKNLDDFTLPLVPQAISILETLHKLTGSNQYVFSISNKHISSESGNNALEIMGYNDEEKGMKQRLHGFRGTFRSLANTHQEKHSVSLEAKEAVLDHHVGGAVERAYTHKSNYTEQMRKLLGWYADFLEKIKNKKN